MSIASLAGVLKIFGGGEASPDEQAQLAKEVMLMTLARATAADTNIKDIEVEKVREVIKARSGDDHSVADVRVAANSRMYETAPLEKYITSSAKTLLLEDRMQIAQALADVVNADGRVSDREIEFFNMVASALHLTPAQLMGLNAD